jgi:hypothetical protein
LVTKKRTLSHNSVSPPVPNLVDAKSNKKQLLLMPTGDGYTESMDTTIATLETVGTQQNAQMPTLAPKTALLMESHLMTGKILTVSVVTLIPSNSVSLPKELML